MRTLLALLLIGAGAPALAADQLTLQPAELERLAALPVGASTVVADFPDGFGGHADLRFERIDVYAAGARVVAVTATGERELPRSARIELIGANPSRDVRASLSFDPDWTRVAGAGSSTSGAFAIVAARDRGSLVVRVVPEHETLPAGVVPEVVANEDGLPSGRALPQLRGDLSSLSAPVLTPRGATVAVDTDNEFMSVRFGNDTTAATNWIADLFATMNVMYENDLDVQLVQGATYLRTGSDPYTQNDSPASQADLTEFGSYWQAHYAAVPRAFAMLLSGKSSSGNSASGIAWINAYCHSQSQGGSYSVNQIFTNAQVGVAFSARIVGHELGHNFGAYHTHCTNIATGGAPTASNTIDQCYRAESGCYSGAVSCPVAGPGHPLGTLMSYCNTGAPNGANCGQNVLQFHPTQVGTLSALVAQHTPSCLSASADLIFANGFD